MKRLILTAALISSPALAETVEVFVVDESGDGVLQYQSNATIAESEVLIQGARPEGATGVVLEEGKSPQWTDLSPEAVNQNYGGNGAPPIVNHDDDDLPEPSPEPSPTPEPTPQPRPSPSPTPAPDDGEELANLGLEDTKDFFPEFDSMQSARIQPRDGYWVIEIRDQTFTGCPGGVEQAASAQMAALQTAGNRGIFGPNFTPEQMAPQLDWTQVGANSWFGSLDMGQSGGGAVMQWGVQVISPELINHRQQLNFDMSGLGNCEVSTFVQSAWAN